MNIYLTAFISSLISALIAYGLYKLIAPSKTPDSASKLALKWSAFVLAFAVFTEFPSVILGGPLGSVESTESILTLLIVAVGYAFIGYVAGYLFGLFKFRGK
jgi:hypothetical protein